MFACFCIGGCANPNYYPVAVESFSLPQVSFKNKYILLARPDKNNISNLQFNEFSRYVDIVLQDSGFIKVNDVKNADISIFLSYGVNGPHYYNYTYNVPTWGQTGASSSQTSATMQTFGNVTTYSSNTNHNPTYGITGYSTRVGTSAVYYLYLDLEGVDLEEYKKKKKINNLPEIWVVKAEMISRSNDLRRNFPFLIAAAQKCIGKSTGKKLIYQIEENDIYQSPSELRI